MKFGIASTDKTEITALIRINAVMTDANGSQAESVTSLQTVNEIAPQNAALQRSDILSGRRTKCGVVP